MKKNNIFIGVILAAVIFGAGYLLIKKNSKSKLFSGVYATICPLCNCMSELSSYQISLIRQGATPACFICKKCRNKK
ncbi:MAG: hypothetical protein NG737_06160 [Omnitrophica bacterium]|nr:hypothetical protein [Candidatus Omnitrophota bacterium]